MSRYAQINVAQVDAATGIYRGTLSGLSWVDDTGAEVTAPAPPSGAWINVRGISERTGVAYVLLADPDADTLNLAVTWEADVPVVQPVAAPEEPATDSAEASDREA